LSSPDVKESPARPVIK